MKPKIPAYLRPYIHRCCICGTDTWLTRIVVVEDNPPLTICCRSSGNDRCEDEFDKLFGPFAADGSMTYEEFLRTLPFPPKRRGTHRAEKANPPRRTGRGRSAQS